ncbi:MAG: TRAFAC clade GTPase domain-containing protein [Planctomycetaceae bacterium]
MMTTQIHPTSDSASLQCICCGETLTHRDDYCDECQTPASVSRTAAGRVGAQSFVSVLGASNAGKTVYLGLLLDMLSKGSDAMRGAATGAFSIDLQEQVVTALERRSFPEKTPSEADAWKWFHCQISMAEKKKTRYVDLISPDFAGEAIAMEINHAGMYPSIGHVVRRSTGLMILCDSIRVRDSGSSEDLFAMKLASYIAEQHALETDGGRIRHAGPAVAIVFTKCDGCPEAIQKPAQFAANNTPRLYEFCRRTFARHSFFAASVAGCSGILADSAGRQMRVPFHIQPYGIIEPLQWIVTQP